MASSARRERQLWSAAAVYTAAIYLSLNQMRSASEYLRERNLLRLTLAAGFLATVIAIGVWMWRRRAGIAGWLILAVAAITYAALLPLAVKAEERFHLLEYGALGALLYLAAAERSSPGAAAWTAFLLAAALGWIDEGIQELLPGRFYGLADLVINAAAGGIAAATLAALDRFAPPRPATGGKPPPPAWPAPATPPTA